MAISTIWIVALSPGFIVQFVGSETCGRQTVPGNGPFEGPKSWKGATIGFDMFNGPPSGPSVPTPMLT